MNNNKEEAGVWKGEQESNSAAAGGWLYPHAFQFNVLAAIVSGSERRCMHYCQYLPVIALRLDANKCLLTSS